MKRNYCQLIHWYFDIDEEIIWKVITEQFPTLKIQIEMMKQELDRDRS